MRKKYLKLKLDINDIYDFGDDIRAILQSDNIIKGINYEKIIYREIKDGNSSTTKLKFNVDTISFTQFKNVVKECLSDNKNKYYFPNVLFIKNDGNEIIIDAILVENNTLKIVEIKKNLLQIDTGKSDNVYDRGILVKNILSRELPNIDSHLLIVGMENVSTDKFNRLELYCNSNNIMIGEKFLNKLGLDYNKIYNEVHTSNLENVKKEIEKVIFKYNNQ